MLNYSNYGNDLNIKVPDIKKTCTSGDNGLRVEFLSKKPYVKEQINRLDKDNLAKELKEHGAWSEEELNDHEQNIQRWLWISVWDCFEALTI